MVWARGGEMEGAGEVMLEASGGNMGSEDMVQDFVSLSMMRILQPFSDSLRCLQAEVERLSSELAETCETSSEHEQRILQQEQAASKLEAGAADSAGQLEKALSEMVALKREKTRLDGNHEMTKASVAKTKEMLAALTSSVESTGQELAQSKEKIAGLERGLVDIEQRVVENVDGRLDKQGRVCKEVNERSVEMLKSCQQAKKLGESAHFAIKELSVLSEKHWLEDGESLRDLKELSGAMQSRLAEVDDLLHSHAESSKVASREVQHLRTWTDQLKDVHSLQAKQADVQVVLAEQTRRLDQAEKHITEIHAGPLRDKLLEDIDVGNLRESFEAVAAEVKQLLRWKDSQKTQSDILSSASHRLGELDSGHQALESQIEVVNNQLRELTVWHHGVNPQLAAQDSSLQQVHRTIADVQTRMESTSSCLKGVRSELDGEHEHVAKLSLRIDTCCKYFNGLGKGLQDTHRQIVSGEGGMLPSGKVPMLPALPRTPRALKSASPSQRRVTTPLASPRRMMTTMAA